MLVEVLHEAAWGEEGRLNGLSLDVLRELVLAVVGVDRMLVVG